MTKDIYEMPIIEDDDGPEPVSLIAGLVAVVVLLLGVYSYVGIQNVAVATTLTGAVEVIYTELVSDVEP